MGLCSKIYLQAPLQYPDINLSNIQLKIAISIYKQQFIRCCNTFQEEISAQLSTLHILVTNLSIAVDTIIGKDIMKRTIKVRMLLQMFLLNYVFLLYT